mmetsp:Transcript_31988/g.28350  ORF Transcript_31988/g.28350 Transcript_31988/m.28350 type:complete len:99 (-) Transcript_31988:64-360(-)
MVNNQVIDRYSIDKMSINDEEVRPYYEVQSRFSESFPLARDPSSLGNFGGEKSPYFRESSEDIPFVRKDPAFVKVNMIKGKKKRKRKSSIIELENMSL